MSMEGWRLIFLTMASRCTAQYKMEYKTDGRDYLQLTTDSLTVAEGSPFTIRCLFENYGMNNSIVWEVSSQAWKSSLWMDKTQMGLDESVNEAEDMFITEVYVTSAGIKDVGNYQCVDYDDDELQLDPGGVWVYVKGSHLTPLNSSEVEAASDSGPMPCLPAFPDVKVRLSGDGEDLTSAFHFNPRKGFTRQSSSVLARQPSAYSCIFSYGNQTESIRVAAAAAPPALPGLAVTLHLKQSALVSGESAQLVCKVTSRDSLTNLPLDIYWRVPSLGPSRTLHKDDPTVLFTNRWRVEELELEGVRISTLTIIEVEPEDQGNYTCQVDRVDSRSAEAEVELRVEGGEEAAATTFQTPSLSETSSGQSMNHWPPLSVYIPLLYSLLTVIGLKRSVWD